MKRMRNLFFLSLVVFSMAGCGGNSSSSDTAPPSVVSSTPANGAKKVSVLSDVRVTMSEDLMSSSVNTSTVTVNTNIWTGPLKSSGTVTYESATKTIVFHPTAHLATNATYTVTLSGVKDLAGNTMPDTAISFKTCVNPITNRIYYYGGSVTDYYNDTFDSNGNLTRDVWYIGPGNDKTWFTDDDQISSYYTYTYDSGTKLTRTTYYSGAGLDLTWFTGDDFVDSYLDAIYNAEGQNTRSVTSNVTGSVTDYSDYSYDANGNFTRVVYYTGAGNNGTWFDGDDVVSVEERYSYDSYGRRTRLARCQPPGPDGQCFTADDPQSYYLDYTFDSDGKVTRYTRYRMGTDGIWFNADDNIISYTDYIYDAADNNTRRITYGCGLDTICFNSDDTIRYYEEIVFNAEGNEVRCTYYSGYGSDATWFTPDDDIYVKDEYDTTQ